MRFNDPHPPVSVAVAQPLAPAALWPALQDAIKSRPGLAWIRNLQLRSIDDTTARFAPLPGAREAANFAAQPRNRDTLEQLLQQIIGRRLRVEIDTTPVSKPEGDESPLVSPSPEAGAAIQRGLTREERDAAMNLPTVKVLQQLFDITLIDARPDHDTPANNDPDSE